MSPFDPSGQTPVVRLRLLIEAIGVVAREPGYGPGYIAVGEVHYREGITSIDVWMPPQNERPMQLRIGAGASGPLVGLDGSNAILRAWDWKTEEELPAVMALEALGAAEQLLAKLDARRREWIAQMDPTAGERIIRAFFTPWPQSLAAALAAFERQRSSTPIRRPMEMDSGDLGLEFWHHVFAAGHLTGLRLVDFCRESDMVWTADRFRQQPEPPQAAAFRDAREEKLLPPALAAAIDRYLALLGWRLVVFAGEFGKPMPEEQALQVIADASAAGLAAPMLIALGKEAFR